MTELGRGCGEAGQEVHRAGGRERPEWITDDVAVGVGAYVGRGRTVLVPAEKGIRAGRRPFDGRARCQRWQLRTLLAAHAGQAAVDAFLGSVGHVTLARPRNAP